MRALLKSLIWVLIAQELLIPSVCFAGRDDILILDTKSTGLSGAKTGSVFITNISKDPVLVKTNFWGGVKSPGIHYLPEGVDLITAISLAGGPVGEAQLGDVELTSLSGQTLVYDLEGEDRGKAREVKLKAGDIVNVPVSKFYERTPFWIFCGSFLLSAATFYIYLSDRNK